MAASNNDQDMSKNVILSLMFLAVVVTFIGTLLIFSSIEDLKSVPSEGTQSGQGKVAINILSDEPAQEVLGSGKVGITIEDSNNYNQ